MTTDLKPEIQPFIPDDKWVPEFTIRSVLVGIFLAVLMGATNAYLGLKVGMTVSATIPAAVVSLAIFKAIGGTILETNFSKTMASAGEALAAGVIFTIPAFVIIGAWTEIRYLETTLIALIGGILGVLFTISLRHILIVEEALPFPEGVAGAEVLFAGWEGGTSAHYVFGALAVGFAYKFFETLHIAKGKVEAVFGIGRFRGYFGGEMSAALVSVGYIVGPKIATYVFLGGIIGWILVLPIFLSMAMAGSYPGINPATMTALEIVEAIRLEQIIWIGIGAIVFGGIWTMLSIRKSVTSAFGEALKGIRGIEEKKEVRRTEKDLPVDKTLLAAAAMVVPIFGLYLWMLDSGFISGVSAVIMLIAAFFFTAVSGYMAGVIGSSNNPISGITITTLLFTSLLVFALGARGTEAMASALAVGAVVCCAAAIAGDVLQDFKTGQIVGSTPSNLQMGEMIGVVATALTIAPILLVLQRAYGIGTPALPAPQAQVMGSFLQAFFGGTMNFGMFILGIELAILLVFLKIPILPVAVGIYLPLTLSTPIMLGGVIHAVVDRVGRKHKGNEVMTEKLHNRGILVSSGLIAGEALMGIAGAVIIVMGLHPGITPIPFLGEVLFLFVVFMLFKLSLGGVGGNLGEGMEETKGLAADSYKNAKEKIKQIMK